MAPLHSLSCVPHSVRGAPRYVGDHVIRAYRVRGLASLLEDLGAPACDSITIVGGIGTLTMYADGREDWNPTIRKQLHPAPIQADPELVSARTAICSTCQSMTDRCTAAGCGCAGEGKPTVWSSRCPLGKWPTPTPIDCNP